MSANESATTTAADNDRRLKALSAQLSGIAPPQGSYERLSQRLRASRREKHWSVALVIVCVLTPVAMMLLGRASELASMSFLTTAAAGGLMLWSSARQQSRTEALQSLRGDFFDAWRRDLRERMRTMVASALFAGIWGLGLMSLALLRPFTPGQALLIGLVAVLVMFGAARAILLELRDLRAELQSLSDVHNA